MTCTLLLNLSLSSPSLSWWCRISEANFYVSIGGGYSNNATASYASIGGGQKNIASNQMASIGGGKEEEEEEKEEEEPGNRCRTRMAWTICAQYARNMKRRERRRGGRGGGAVGRCRKRVVWSICAQNACSYLNTRQLIFEHRSTHICTLVTSTACI